MQESQSPPADAAWVQGVVARRIYAAAEGNFAILALRLDSGGELTVLGELSAVPIGLYLRCRGRYQDRPNYGRQLAVDAWEPLLPQQGRGIVAFLSSGFFPQIGPKRAEKIYRAYGEKVFRCFDEDPEQLLRAGGLSPRRWGPALAAWRRYRGQAELRSALASTLGPELIERLLRRWPELTLSQLRENPFLLLQSVPRLGFLRCDRLARSLGTPPTSRQRIWAGLRHRLAEAEAAGDLFLPQAKLSEETAKLLQLPLSAVAAVWQSAAGEQPLAVDADAQGQAIVYLPENREAEVSAAADLRRLQSAPSGLPPIAVERALPWAQQAIALPLAEAQQQALRRALQHKVTLLTGGPGTGKTTALRALVAILAKKSIPFALAAPTGRAAQRMSESCGAVASTLHRLLEYNPAAHRFQRHARQRLALAFLVIDECSMLDLPLLAATLAALPSRSHLLLLGDAQQLPSVGPGQVLADLCRCRRFPRTELTRVYRQAEGSAIAAAAQAVCRGAIPESAGAEFRFQEAADAETQQKDLAMALDAFSARGFDLFREVQVLTPVHRGPLGTEALNPLLQRRINPRGAATTRPPFSCGDKVLQLRNNYRDEIFNGEIGLVLGEEERGLRLRFESREVIYSPSDLDDLRLAYAISIHKSQGSEYPVAVIVLPEGQSWFLQRSLLYTALTRAKAQALLLGSRRALSACLANQRGMQRHSLLWHRLAAAEAFALG